MGNIRSKPESIEQWRASFPLQPYDSGPAFVSGTPQQVEELEICSDDIEPSSPECSRTVLMCGGLGLTEPPEVMQWQSFSEIYLMENQLTELAEDPRCPVLLVLFLNRNYKLRTISASFFDYMPALEILNLSRTRIKSLPESLFRLSRLKRLFLNHCELLMVLPPKIGELQQLEVLDLEGTEIMHLPKEVAKLTRLTCLEVSFCRCINRGAQSGKANALISQGTISALSQLEELSIDVNPEDERWESVVEAIVDDVCGLMRLDTLKLYFPQVDHLRKFECLRTSKVCRSLSHFKFIVGNHDERIMSRLPVDPELEFDCWDRSLRYVNGVGVPINIQNMLRHTTAFFLDRHTNVTKLSDFGIENMEQVKCCIIGECNETQVIIDGTDLCDEADRSEIALETCEDDRRLLGSLEYLYVYRMKSLRSIYEGLLHRGCLSHLKCLVLLSCPRLTTIFTPELVKNLDSLEELKVEDCPLVESLVRCEDPLICKGTFLPRLKKIFLFSLPGLISLCYGLRIAPNLERMSIFDCPNLRHPSTDEVSCNHLIVTEDNRKPQGPAARAMGICLSATKVSGSSGPETAARRGANRQRKWDQGKVSEADPKPKGDQQLNNNKRKHGSMVRAMGICLSATIICSIGPEAAACRGANRRRKWDQDKASEVDPKPKGDQQLNNNKWKHGGAVPCGKRTNFGYAKDFAERYSLGKLLGYGQLSYTYVAIDRANGDRVAVKRIEKNKMVLPIAVEDVKREVKILRALTGHENVVQFYDAFEDDSYVYIAMEYCEGGELLDRILAKKDSRYTEKDAAVVVRQMLKVAAQCHLHGLVHRDMKPENFLFKSTKEDSPLKATDFGLSDFIKPGKRFQDIVGSAYYVAPEVLKRESGPESDVWSIGVITYILLCGRRPFWDKTEDGIFKEVLKNKPDFNRKPWPTISNSAKDFVKKLLVKDPRARLTAAQALSHPWVRGGGSASDIPIDISVLNNMRQFVKYSRLKQFALRALASTLDEEELADLKDQFAVIDVDKNGSISLEEMRQALAQDLPWKLKESRVLEILQAIDSNTDGLVDFTEFVAATLNVHQMEEHDSEKWQLRSQAAFEKFDIDRDGYITPEELRLTGLKDSLDPLLEEADIDKDGKISLSEFRRLLRTASMGSHNLPGPSGYRNSMKV